MKKYLIYISFLIIGVLLGLFLFKLSTKNSSVKDKVDKPKINQMWTCSMHPQIMQPNPGNCPICGMKLIHANNDINHLNSSQFKLTKNAISLANIQTSIVGGVNNKDNNIILSGKIIENEKTNSVQVSYFSGRIERLNINSTGEKIHKGQLLATIYSPELYAAQQELLTVSSFKKTKPSLYKAVRKKLKFWKLSEKTINKIESSGIIKEYFPIYATVTGTIIKKLINQGDYVKQGQPLFEISNLNSVWANFDVYENQIKLFSKNQEIEITTNSYPNISFKSKVDFIDPYINNKTRTSKLRVVLKNNSGELKPGMFVEGKIKSSIENKNNLLQIPSSSVLWTGKRSVVYIKTNPNEPIFEMREITLGNKIGNSYEILDGLKKGEEIVTNGTFTIDSEAQLKGKKSMMNKIDKKNLTKNTGNDKEKNKKSKKIKRIKVSLKFQEQLKNVFNYYINLKDALANDNAIKAKEEADNLIKKLNIVNMKLLPNPSVHMIWMEQEKEIKNFTKKITLSTDIKIQRNLFRQLSINISNCIKYFGINKEVYKQFCPMANNNKGAFWLSESKKIINPFYGKSMPDCGELKEVIK